MLADNASSRLLSLLWEVRSAALTLALHLHAFLACGDAVPIAFENPLGNPAEKRRIIVLAVEPCKELGLELLDVCHRDV